jgi:hypothetical protein
VRVDGQKPDTRRQRRTSGLLAAKSKSIKGAKRRSGVPRGDPARKAAELTPGDLLRVRNGLRLSKGGLTAEQKSAEGILGHDVGKASEALRKPKGGAMDRPNRERRLKARTGRSGQ